MAIASKNLFHFTSQYDTLVKILEGKAFWPRYCCEYDWFNDKTRAMFIPMVCFTDIPLTQAYTHMDFYGHYGIGLSKTWAKSQNICPVWYVKKKSLQMIVDMAEKESAFRNPKICNILTFCKRSTRGRCKNRFGDVKIKDFYEDREWRFVPNIPVAKKIIQGKDTEQLGNNEDTKSHMLKFSLDDIRYIFVDMEEERVHLIDKIEEMYSMETSFTRALLKSKIITIKQLREDF